MAPLPCSNRLVPTVRIPRAAT